MAVDSSSDIELVSVTVPGQTEVVTISVPGIQGPPGKFKVGTVTTGAPGTSAAVTTTENAQGEQVVSFAIPRGDVGATGSAGPPNALTIGTVTTGAPGSSASASITGVAPNQTLSLTIPQGQQGPQGAGAPDATTTAKGSIQLAGDLAGTATAPTVPTKVSKSGDTMTGTLTLPDLGAVRATAVANKIYVPDVSAVAQSPFADLYHDILAFGRHIPFATFEVSDDGVAWTAATLDKELFAMRERRSTTLIDPNTSRRYVRFTWNSLLLQFSDVNWLVIGYGYGGAVDPLKTVTVESSSDGAVWTKRHESSYDKQAAPVWHSVSSWGGASQVRLTIRHHATNAAGTASPSRVIGSSIRFLTPRWGDQGGGVEYEFPFDWNADRGVTFISAKSSTAPSATDDLTRKDYVDTGLSGKANATHAHAISDLTASGTRDATTYLRGDGTWATPPTSGGGGTVTSANITDATEVGRSVLTSVDAAAARTAIGAGTSNLAIGTTSTTAAAGDHTHTAANISDSTAVGRSVLMAVDAPAARTAIGAGTSSLVIGTTATTAMAGNKTFTKSDVGLGNVDNTSDANKPVSTAQQTALEAKAPLAGVEGIKIHDGTAGGGTRPTGYARIRWVGGTTRPTNMVVGDVWERDA